MYIYIYIYIYIYTERERERERERVGEKEMRLERRALSHEVEKLFKKTNLRTCTFLTERILRRDKRTQYFPESSKTKGFSTLMVFGTLGRGLKPRMEKCYEMTMRNRNQYSII